jgi:hypothetical protein
MSQDFEKFIKSQDLKEPSENLDDRVLALFDEPAQFQSVKKFPWQKFVMYAVAAMLFLSIGVTEIISSNTTHDEGETVGEVDQPSSSVVVPTVRVSNDRKLKDGRMTRPSNK